MDIQSLLLLILKEDKSKEEYDKLKSWKSESKENLEMYQEYIKLAEQGVSLEDYKEFDTAKGYNRFEDSRKSNAILPKILILFLLASIIAAFFYFKNASNTEEIKLHHYAADKEVQIIELKDKSIVNINTSSAITEITDFASTREVSLKGEAYFDISRDVERPFKVHLENENYIEVLGTTFNVINDGEKLEIYVFSGQVALHTNERKIHLSQGDRISKINGDFVKYRRPDDNYLSWKNKKIVFKEAGITTVMEDLSRHYDFDFSIDKNLLKNQNCKINSQFENETLESVFSELSKIINLKYTKKGKSYHIFDLNC